ncbi:MAG TPA: MFS transporter [Mycobacteriales bacterium]|nr:MFS transporter [Mycobacteriales bacterium]
MPTEHTTSNDARPLLLTLGLPTFGLAFAITVLTTYGPSIVLGLTHSAAKTGALIGGEGAFALVIPLISGGLSDRLKGASRFGKRMPFVLVGGPLAGGGLALLPFAPDYQLAGIFILAFFVGYYLYYPPYRAIYADLLPKRLLARAQSSQAVMRGAGLGIALIAGGTLLSAWKPLPFILGAAVLGVTTLPLRPIHRLTRTLPPTPHEEPASGNPVAELLLHNRSLQIFAAANAIWEYSFAGLKTFIVLYVVKGLGHSYSLASAVIAIVAVAYVIGAPIASRLAEHYGIVRVMEVAAAIYGALLTGSVLSTTITPMLVVLPLGAMAGSILMTLPQALAFTLAPDTNQGAAAGLVDFSRAIGVVLGPVLVGAAVSATSSSLSATHGYAAMWPMIGVPMLVSLALLHLLRDRVDPVPQHSAPA